MSKMSIFYEKSNFFIYSINKNKPLIFHIADTEMRNDANKYNL